MILLFRNHSTYYQKEKGNLMKYYRTPDFDPLCQRCSLSTGKAISSNCLVPFKQALLLVYSAYPGRQEELSNLTLCPNERDNNAGAYLHSAISRIFDGYVENERLNRYKPFVERTLFGNVIRCNPQQGREKKSIKTNDLKECFKWTLADLSKVHPKVPILLSGSEAIKSFLGRDVPLYPSRRKLLNFDNHPVIVCENFINGEKYSNYQVTETRVNKLGIEVPKGNPSIAPPIPSSPTWHMDRDIELVRNEVIKFLEENNL